VAGPKDLFTLSEFLRPSLPAPVALVTTLQDPHNNVQMKIHYLVYPGHSKGSLLSLDLASWKFHPEPLSYLILKVCGTQLSFNIKIL
jgi:hypothetical protein